MNKNDYRKWHFFKRLIPLIITILLFDIVSDTPVINNFKKELIKQHSEENLLNLSRQENLQIITKIIFLYFHKNSVMEMSVQKPLILKFLTDHITCITSINKYPRWSKSTFS